MRVRFLAVNLLNLFVALVEGFLGLRFLLKLLVPIPPRRLWLGCMT